MSGPLIVQSDKTALLEIDHPDAINARHDLSIFAELERAPEHIHTYRITKLGLWNARAAGHDSQFVIDVLEKYSKYPIPPAVTKDIADLMSRYGKLHIQRDDENRLLLLSDDKAVLAEVGRQKKIKELITEPVVGGFVLAEWARGAVKQELLKIGWPAEDLAGYAKGEPMAIELDTENWSLRDYQTQAVNRFNELGSGVVVLPCGAGKTLVGAAAMAEIKTNTLILVTNSVSARQWREELVNRTTLTEDQIAEYSGSSKDLAEVTIATYQILTTKRGGQYRHLELLNARDWGLIVYDEVHLLPAPIFKMTAELQAKRRLGLTATLVREDGREGDVFSLIGPKRFDALWKDIEAEGYIAPANCYEVRIPLTDEKRMEYAIAQQEERFRIASTIDEKIALTKQILKNHPGEPALIIGQYLDQIEQFSKTLDIPKLTGETPVDERERLYKAFREGTIPALVVSRVANFSVDLPEASVAIQVSGSFGSRQEEAQRLGRVMRPKADGRSAHFYTLISRDTVEQDFAQNRQRFLAEQGYGYQIIDSDQL
ncbi:MAG: DEAD/DEAH box helicase [Microbacteriaceae bacterium]|nr:DEAD/DEAH box helicase [Microbacteriaceae bacterium]MDR9444207.1 DEAD/DEAH box helicase [Microbacteriaceae bacterium]